MTRQLNPFIFGRPVPPTYFIGREEIIGNCYRRLAGPVRSSIAISGEHGVGKTSLLYYLCQVAQQEGWGQPYTRNIFLYLDCQGLEPFTPTRFWRSVLEALKQAEDDPALHRQIDDLWAQPEIEASHFQRHMLRWLNQQKLSLVLLLDGFTWLVKTDAAHRDVTLAFLVSLRALINHPDYPLTLLTATRQPLDVLCYDLVKEHGSPFYNNFTFEPLYPFTPAEVNTLLERAMKEADLHFDETDCNLLHHMANSHPALLQMAGYHLLEERRQGPLNTQTYQQVIDNFERSARHYFVQFWGEASPLEQTLFILIILLHLSEQASLQAEMPPQEIQPLLQKYEHYLLPLAERGLIQPVEDSYQIFSAVFAWWIVRQVAVVSEATLTEPHPLIGEEPLRRAWQTLKELAPRLTLDKLTQALVARPSRPVTPPRLPSRYELQAEVGRGASGIVYKAFDTHLARPVAIKVLHDPLGVSPVDGRHRLLQEARAASKLKHPHIVTIYDVEEVSGQIFLVMEYVEGQTLVELLRKEEPLPLPRIISLIEQAAVALDYAHEHGVIHRDIKPANLMLSAGGDLKLGDFGIAKIVNDTITTRSDSIKGTILYMSPEQIKQKPLDGRSDLFSLAVVAFEMICGASPWLATTHFELVNDIVEATLRPLADFDIPAAALLEQIFQKALAKNPEDRYQKGEAFVRALKEAAVEQTNSG